MSRITANGIELNYDRTGSGEPLVLVHGGWSDRNIWQLVVPGLAASFSVVAYDRRGHGLSARDAGGTRRDQEDDLAALIEGLGAGPATIVGTSFGGSIAHRPGLPPAGAGAQPDRPRAAADRRWWPATPNSPPSRPGSGPWSSG